MNPCDLKQLWRLYSKYHLDLPVSGGMPLNVYEESYTFSHLVNTSTYLLEKSYILLLMYA